MHEMKAGGGVREETAAEVGDLLRPPERGFWKIILTRSPPPPNGVSFCDQGLRNHPRGRVFKGFQNPKAPSTPDVRRCFICSQGPGPMGWSGDGGTSVEGKQVKRFVED